jgi:hypothetical protein
MAIDKKSLALGLAIGGKWNYHAESGDLCVLGPVIFSMEIRRPTAFSDDALPLTEGVSLEELALLSASTTFHGVTVFSDAAAALAEELNDEQHDVSAAYLYTGEVQEVNMNDNETNENMNNEEITVTSATMEVDS